MLKRYSADDTINALINICSNITSLSGLGCKGLRCKNCPLMSIENLKESMDDALAKQIKDNT